MGTRSEIWVIDSEGRVELYKHNDGYPDYMIPFFRRLANWAANKVKDGVRLLGYKEEVAAMMIAYDFITAEVDLNSFGPNPMGVWPDIRPRGTIDDLIEYVYVFKVKEEGNKVIWDIRGYEVPSSMWGKIERGKVRGLKEVRARLRLEIYNDGWINRVLVLEEDYEKL